MAVSPDGQCHNEIIVIRSNFMVLVAFGMLASCMPVGPERSEGVSIPGKEKTALTSKIVVAAFTDAGLEARKPRPMTSEDFGEAPLRTNDATSFLIPIGGSDLQLRGFALVFDNADDLRATKRYYAKVEDADSGNAGFFTKTFVNIDRLVLVQIESVITEKKNVRKYRAVVKES